MRLVQGQQDCKAREAEQRNCALTCDLICCNAAVEEVDQEKPGIAALERQMLQKRIGEPLAAVQTLLQRDKVVWSTGVLATPSVCILHRQ